MLQSQVIAQIFDLIYPVGSLYFSTTLDTKEKVQKLFGGTWEKLPDGYAIWTASSGAGETIAPGLPNIVGGGINGYGYGVISGTSGPFKVDMWREGVGGGGSYGNAYQFNFDASENGKDPIYGKSDTVQPPAYKVYAYRRLTTGGGLRTFIASIIFALKRRKIC